MSELSRKECSFCGEDQGKRCVLIQSPERAGVTAYICEQCVAACLLVVADFARRLVIPFEEYPVAPSDQPKEDE